MNNFIPVNTPLFEGNEKKYLDECIETSWISSEGPFVKTFESKFSQYCERKYGVAVSSGSAALDIAIKAIGIKQGDEVIMPTFTIISPSLSIIKSGGIPVYVDSKPDTWNINVDQIEEKITSKTKAILIVHIYGLPVEMNKVLFLAKKHNLLIIEDAAEMHGQTYFGKKCGSFGDISIFSFYANKNITTGEGGMIVCDDLQIAEKCRKYANLGFEPEKPRFIHYETGWNYRMTNLQAAIGVAQLEQIDQFLIKKREIGSFYYEKLSFLTNYGFKFQRASTDYSNNIYWVFGILAPTEEEKTKLVKSLEKDLIATRPFFWCMHEQPIFLSEKTCIESFPVAESLARLGFYIPSGLGITNLEMNRVVESIRKYYA